MNLCSSVVSSMFLAFLSMTAASDGLVALQKSVFNDNTPDLALDGDNRTCAVTGYDLGGWWKVDHGKVLLVTGFIVRGSSAAIQARVGNFSDALGLRGGFSRNGLCHFSPLGIDAASQPRLLSCRNPIAGRYSSIEVVDPVSVSQLSLCDVQIQHA